VCITCTAAMISAIYKNSAVATANEGWNLAPSIDHGVSRWPIIVISEVSKLISGPAALPVVVNDGATSRMAWQCLLG
jgi:hypothetical protein